MKYPKSEQLLRERSKKALEEFIEGVRTGLGVLQPEAEDSFKEILSDENIDRVQKSMLENNPRHLYDFFDENEIFVHVIFYEKNYWEYVINLVKSLNSFDSRLEAEKLAFEEAFKILEAKL